MQPFEGDGLHVDAAKPPDASGPLTSTPRRMENASTRGDRLSSQTTRYGSHETIDLGASGTLVTLITVHLLKDSHVLFRH